MACINNEGRREVLKLQTGFSDSAAESKGLDSSRTAVQASRRVVSVEILEEHESPQLSGGKRFKKRPIIYNKDDVGG